MRGQIKEYRYIYNPVQANFYIQNDLRLEEIGISEKQNDIFFKFKDSEELQRCFRKWMDRKVV